MAEPVASPNKKPKGPVQVKMHSLLPMVRVKFNGAAVPAPPPAAAPEPEPAEQVKEDTVVLPEPEQPQ